MNKKFKLISIGIALICLFTGCSQKPDSDKVPEVTSTYYVVKQEISPAPYGAEMNVYYNMDGQMSKIEFFHPEFPDEMVFNYDNSSKLSNIVAIYNDDESGYTDEKCMWAYEEGDFPNMELVTHKFTYKEIPTTP